RRHTRFSRDWSSDVCSSDLVHVERIDVPNVTDVGVAHRIVRGGADDLRPRGPPHQQEGVWGELPNYLDPALRAGLERWPTGVSRSEERRVGKEGRARGARCG